MSVIRRKLCNELQQF